MTLWITARQVPLSIEFPRKGYWSGLPFPPPGLLNLEFLNVLERGCHSPPLSRWKKGSLSHKNAHKHPFQFGHTHFYHFRNWFPSHRKKTYKKLPFLILVDSYKWRNLKLIHVCKYKITKLKFLPKANLNEAILIWPEEKKLRHRLYNTVLVTCAVLSVLTLNFDRASLVAHW